MKKSQNAQPGNGAPAAAERRLPKIADQKWYDAVFNGVLNIA